MSVIYSIHIKAEGHIQGVFYRSTTKQWAEEAGVRGWIKNNVDGSVNAMIQHEDIMVLFELIDKMKQGPPGAMIRNLRHSEVEMKQHFSTFTIIK